MCLAKKWNIEVRNFEITTAHSLYFKTNTPDIIAQFIRKDTVEKSKLNKLESNSLQLEPTQPVYCSEHLTLYTKRILSQAKNLRQ